VDYVQDASISAPYCTLLQWLPAKPDSDGVQRSPMGNLGKSAKATPDCGASVLAVPYFFLFMIICNYSESCFIVVLAAYQWDPRPWMAGFTSYWSLSSPVQRTADSFCAPFDGSHFANVCSVGHRVLLRGDSFSPGQLGLPERPLQRSCDKVCGRGKK
jgi:hypothetical protein